MERITKHGNLLLALVGVAIWASPAAAQIFTTVDEPPPSGSSGGTILTNIAGNTILGYFGSQVPENGSAQGFVYNGSTFTPFSDPLGVATVPYGISGNIISGLYFNNGNVSYPFFYNGSAFSTVSDPYPNGSFGYGGGISGNTMVGYFYVQGSGQVGFQYNVSTGSLATITVPWGFPFTRPTGISGGNIVGWYETSSYNFSSFLYNGSTYAQINDPLATTQGGDYGTYAEGISGNYVVGNYQDTSLATHGFLYNISTSTYTTIDDPLGVKGTWIYGTDGNRIVGCYEDSSGSIHGFVENLFNASWTGATNHAWSLAGSDANWSVPSGSPYANGMAVTFPDLGTNQTIAIAAGGVQPASLVFSNNAIAYNLSGGAISGSASLTLIGSGGATISNANTYTGPTTISAGTLTLTHPLGMQNSTVTVGPAGGLNFAGAATTPSVARWPAWAALPWSRRPPRRSRSAWAATTKAQRTVVA